MRQLHWTSILFYALSLAATKVSILLRYARFFRHTWAEKGAYLLLALVIVTNVWILYVIFTACIPLQAFWDTSVVGTTCHTYAYWQSNNSLNIATGILVLVLPLPAVWKLQVHWGQKATLLTILPLGFMYVT